MEVTEGPQAARTLRACQNCAKSKAKCVPQTDPPDDKCSRCFRLAKACIFMTRNPRKKRSPNTNIIAAQLEQKIENLTALLSSQQQNAANSSPLTPDSQETRNSGILPAPVAPQANTLSIYQFEPEASWSSGIPLNPRTSGPLSLPRPGVDGPSLQASASVRQPSPSPLAMDGDALLDIYREQFAPRFPFVIVPQHITSIELDSQKPWLQRAIAIVAYKADRNKQLEMTSKLTSDIALAMLLRAQKSVDICQCLIIMNVWSYFFSPTAPGMSSMALNSLLFAAIYDIAANRPVKELDLPTEMISDISNSFADNRAKEDRRPTEERRALLTTYFWTALISYTVKKTEGLQYTPYIEYNCQRLLEAAEYQSDIILVALVRIHSILEKSKRDILDSGEKAPIWMHIKASRLELHSYFSRLPVDAQQDRILRLNYYSVELGILEPCLDKVHWPTGSNTGNTHRLDMLYASLSVAKSLLDHISSQSLESWLAFCGADVAPLGYGLTILFKVSLLNEPGWDLEYVRQTANFLAYFEAFYTNFEKAGRTIDSSQREHCRPSFHTMSAIKMKKIRVWFEARMGTESSMGLQGGSEEQNIMDLEMNLNDIEFGDRFLEELMGDAQFM